MQTHHRRIAVLTGALLCLLALPLVTLSATQGAGPIVARLPADAYDPGAVPAAQVLDYGAFVWLELTPEQFAALQAAGVPHEVPPELFTLELGGLRFDPLAGEPDLPPGWDAVRTDGPDLHLVQFVGPTRAEWLDHLRASGLAVVRYIHPYTYVVWGTPGALVQAAASEAVRWTGPFAPAYRVLPAWRNLPDAPVAVSALLVRAGDVQATMDGLSALAERTSAPRALDDAFASAELVLSGASLRAAAQVPGVYSLQLEPTDGGLRGEMSDQINVNNHDPDNLAYPGYLDWLAAAGLDGDGVIIANVDGGVQDTHPDLVNRLVSCTGQTCGGSAASSHGTHTAGIMAADASSGIKDAYGFYRGLGMAPGANLVEQVYSPWYTQPGGMLLLMTESYNNGASLSGNSWGPSGSPQGYDDDTMQVDIGVRDADPDAPGNQPLSYVLSIMNGNGGYQSQGTPDEAKNIFTIGSTKMQYSSGQQILEIDDLSSNTAHGPALDGRLIPHMVAPGCSVDSTVTGSGYGLMCGTSMASPHVSGAVAVFVERYRSLEGVDPSPALIKAAFLPVAHDLYGHDDADGNPLGHPFDAKQGWGRMDAAAVLSPTQSIVWYDNPVILDNTGEAWETTLSAADPGAPVRLMLVWTDAPGHGLGGSTPAWNNDLDLEVDAGGQTYHGNDFGADGWSQPGGSADVRNNTEGVFLGPTYGGSVTLRVVASNIDSDGVPNVGDDTDQDFALVCYNCVQGADFFLNADPDHLAVCAPDEVASSIQVGEVLDYPFPVTLEVLDVPAGVLSALDPVVVVPPGAATLTLDVTAATPDGAYALTVQGTAQVTNVHTVGLDLLVSSGPPAAPALLEPPDGATNQPTEGLTFTWEPLPQVADYRLQVDVSPAFPAPVVDVTGLPEPTYALQAPLSPATCYFWRAQGTNACGEGGWAAPFQFGTVLLDLLFQDDVESGGDAWTATGLWHVSTDPGDPCALPHSGARSWYYGQEPGCNYDVGDNSGTLTLNAPVDLSAALAPASLRFWSWEQTEGSGGYDTRTVYLSPDSVNWTEAWTSTDNGASWYQPELDVSAYVGGDLYIRFEFDSVDSVYNDYVGWYVDDVEVVAALPPSSPPAVLSIAPDAGPPDSPTPVTISGLSFLPTPVALLDGLPLLDVTFVSSTTLTAVVPAGLAPGTYDLTVINGDCQGDTLPDAYTVGDVTTMFVGNIKMKVRVRDPGPPPVYKVLGRVPIFDENLMPVIGATVTAEWTLPSGKAVVQMSPTRPNGSAYFKRTSRQVGLYTLTVLDVQASGYVYDPGHNFETSEELQVP